MKRNDIGYSYVLGLLERVLAMRRVHPAKRTITPPYAGKHSAQPSRVSPVGRTDRYAGTPTIGNARSLSFPFHSPSAIEAGWCGVERRPPVQGRSELQAHDATVLQCLAVEVREDLGRSPGLCHTRLMLLVLARVDRHQLIRNAPASRATARRVAPHDA